jgi:hypothetical protein
MNTKEIDQFVCGDSASRGIFQGVFSVDLFVGFLTAHQHNKAISANSRYKSTHGY